MSFNRWTRLGLTAGLLGSAAAIPMVQAEMNLASEEVQLAGFWEKGEAGEKGEKGSAATTGEGEGGEGEGGEGAQAPQVLPLPKRLAFMAGHIKAGIALYRAGEPDMAAPHLMHPISEAYEAERSGLDELGFQPALFVAVSEAVKGGRPASEVEPQLAAAEAHLEELSEKAGGDVAGIIRFLMDTLIDEYTVAITDGRISDPGEYQDAWGFAVVARDRAAKLNEPFRSDVLGEIDALIALWPAAPVPPEKPADIGRVAGQASRVVLKLPRT